MGPGQLYLRHFSVFQSLSQWDKDSFTWDSSLCSSHYHSGTRAALPETVHCVPVIITVGPGQLYLRQFSVFQSLSQWAQGSFTWDTSLCSSHCHSETRAALPETILCVPVIITVGPGQFYLRHFSVFQSLSQWDQGSLLVKGGKQVVESPAQDHVVVNIHTEHNDGRGVTDSYNKKHSWYRLWYTSWWYCHSFTCISIVLTYLHIFVVKSLLFLLWNIFLYSYLGPKCYTWTDPYLGPEPNFSSKSYLRTESCLSTKPWHNKYLPWNRV